MTNKISQRRRWATVAFVIVIIAILLWLVDFELVLDAIRSADWRFLGAAAVVLLVGYAIEAIRIRYFFGNLPSYKFTFHAMNVSNMMNLVTLIPVTIIRIFLMSDDESITLARATSSISMTMVFRWVTVIIAIMGIILITVKSRISNDFLLLFLCILAGLVGAILFLVSNTGKIATKMTPQLARLPFISEEQSVRLLSDLAHGLQTIGSRRRLLGAFGWTLLTWIIGLIYYALALFAFNIDVPPERLLAGVMFVSIFVNPYAPYLPGVYQAFMIVPLALVSGADRSKLAALSIVLYMLLLIIWFGLGSLGLRRLDLSFKGLRQQVTDHIQQMRSQGKLDDAEAQQS